MGYDVYESVTNSIISALENGTVPWRKPWNGVGCAPANLSTKKTYNGINVWLLAISAAKGGFSSPYWLTFKQAKALGGWVKKGEKGTTIVFWSVSRKTEEGDDGSEKESKFAFLKSYTVFNVDQCERLAKHIPVVESIDHDPIVDAENAAAKYLKKANKLEFAARISNEAWYNPSLDKVSVPELSQYKNKGEYYSVLFHEFGHSTGHKDRLNRKGVADRAAAFGSETYSQEELVAEFCAGFCCASLGVENTLENSAAYIKGWIKVLKGDKKAAVIAASQAQKAADYILN